MLYYYYYAERKTINELINYFNVIYYIILTDKEEINVLEMYLRHSD